MKVSTMKMLVSQFKLKSTKRDVEIRQFILLKIRYN